MSDPARDPARRQLDSEIEIAPLAARHLDEIESIERASYPTPWSRTMFAGEIARGSSICLGAFRRRKVIGYLIVSRYPDAWHVMNLAVAPIWRRRGVATRLLEELFERTDAGGERGYTLEVRVSNGQAIRLYEQLGFETSGIRRGYYIDNREDALIMWRGRTS